MRKTYLFLASLALAACQSSPITEQDVLDAFDQAMFQPPPPDNLDRIGTWKPRLVKWRHAPIYEIRVEGKASQKLVAEIHETVRDFSMLAGMPIYLRDPEEAEQASLIFHIRDKAYFRAGALVQADCLTKTALTRNGTLIQAEISLPGRKTSRARNCLSHEMMHAMGFRGHVRTLPSALNSRQGRDRLSGYDRQMLAILYSPEMKNGIFRENSLQLAAILLRQPTLEDVTDLPGITITAEPDS